MGQDEDMGNITFLFRSRDGETRNLPECFGTSLFIIFLCYLGQKKGSYLKVYQPCLSMEKFELRGTAPELNRLNITGLEFDDCKIEFNRSHAEEFNIPGIKDFLAKIRPDLLLRVRSSDGDRFVVIEVKTTDTKEMKAFTPAQRNHYAEFIKCLNNSNPGSQLLVLTSVGSDGVFKVCREFQEVLKDQFGILLWEDVLREMSRFNFELPGIPIKKWAENYTSALGSEIMC
jgi:hypothetical protein